MKAASGISTGDRLGGELEAEVEVEPLAEMTRSVLEGF